MKADIIERFASLVAEVALEEELRLRRAAGEGIFFMPELAFAFAVGRVVASRADEVFGGPGWVWARERKEHEQGPVDLQFENKEDGAKLFVEFKMRDTLDAYERDVGKLRKIAERRANPEDGYLFCALVDAWAKAPFEDARTTLKAELIEPVTVFTTKQDWYQNRIACVVGVWKVS